MNVVDLRNQFLSLFLADYGTIGRVGLGRVGSILYVLYIYFAIVVMQFMYEKRFNEF